MFGAAVWCMHFVGMLACQLPAPIHFNVPFTILSFLIAFLASSFAIWLTSKPTLPVPRLILSAILMGLGISGMHYTGMMGLVVEGYDRYYNPLMVFILGIGGDEWCCFYLSG